jgi:transposase-like protein
MDAGAELGEGAAGQRRYWTAEEKRRIVEQTLSSGLSVAMIARQHGVNANQIFYWRKLFRAGQLRNECGVEQQLLDIRTAGVKAGARSFVSLNQNMGTPQASSVIEESASQESSTGLRGEDAGKSEGRPVMERIGSGNFSAISRQIFSR